MTAIATARRAAPARGGGGHLPRRPRLRRGVELFPAADGDVYLLHPPSGRDHVIRRPDVATRALLDGLDGRRSVAELARDSGLPVAEAETSVGRLAAIGVLEDAAHDDDSPLSAEDAARLDRQLAYFADASASGPPAWRLQQRLAEATVVIVGVGGLGSWAAAALACAGLGRLVLVDDDTVELSNLNRQVLFRREDVGRPKVDVARAWLGAFHPGIAVEARRERVASAAGMRRLADGASFVVATADSPPHRVSRWINRGCLAAGVPYVAAGQLPPVVRIGPTFLPGRTGCLECHEQAVREAHPLYDELADFRDARPAVAATLGAASGLVGSMLAMEITHALTGICDPATAGSIATIDLRDLSVQRIPVAPHPACPACGGTPAAA